MEWLYGYISDYCEEEYLAAYNKLSRSRRTRIDKKKLECDRKRSLLAEILLLRLMDDMGINTSVECDKNGRPYLANSDLFISLTHSGDMAAAVISEEPVGIDIERIREINPRLINRVCTEEELAYIENRENKTDAFFEVWTAKEAYVKKQGLKITNFKSVNILSLNRTLYRVNGYILQMVF